MKRTFTVDLEDETPGELASVETVIARLIGVPDSEADAVGRFVQTEIRRIDMLMKGHYARMGVRPTTGNYLAIAFLQGVTFREAMRQLAGED